MTIETILPLLQNRRKGSIVTLTTSRPAKVRKGAPEMIKYSIYQVRIGHDYENQASTKAARAEGMKHRTTEEDYAVRLNEFLSKHKHTERIYLSCQPLPNGKNHTAYMVDLKLLTYDDVEPYLLASEKRDHSDTLHLRVPLDTILGLT